MQRACGIVAAFAAAWKFLRYWTPAVLFALVATLMLMCVVSCASSSTINPAVVTHAAGALQVGDVKGCYFTYYPSSGTVLFEPFLKIADKKWSDEYGEPEIWGFRTTNLEPPDEHGKTPPVNIPASLFVPADGKFYEIPAGTTSRRVKCPPW